MTDLSWIAAVLQPRDVTLHPNFTDAGGSVDASRRLAAVVLGGDWAAFAKRSTISDSQDARMVKSVERALDIEQIRDGIAELSGFLSRSDGDVARDTALALVVATASSELDDYATGFRAVEQVATRLDARKNNDDRILAAALFQQRALRELDSGDNPLDTVRIVAELLTKFDPEQATEFTTGPGVAWGSNDTMAGIKETLIASASGLIPSEVKDPPSPLLARMELIKQQPSPVSVASRTKSADEYARFLDVEFDRKYSRAPQGRFGKRPPDLFHAQFALELAGSPHALELRKRVAQMRLVQRGEIPQETRDAIRLLRQSGAKRELELVLWRTGAEGPLEALGSDARQILTARSGPKLVRTLELKVLVSAADILTAREASIGLDIAIRSLEGSGPESEPNVSEIEVVRREVAWSAITALGVRADRLTTAVSVLLDEVRGFREIDELHDRGLRRALSRVEWSRVDKRLLYEWRGMLEDLGGQLPATLELLADEVGLGTGVSSEPTMDGIINWVNRHLRGGDSGESVPDWAAEFLIVRMAEIRSESRRGVFSYPLSSAADVAAALLTLGFSPELWSPLVEMLTDPSVARDAKSAAFDRLANSEVEIPAQYRDVLLESSDDLLYAPSREPMENGLLPFPSALRFLVSHGIVDLGQAFSLIVKHAGSADLEARREASFSLRALAIRHPIAEVLAITLTLSQESDPVVRANCGVVLANLASVDSLVAPMAEARLNDLLESDGIQVPLHVLRGLEVLGGDLSDALRSKVEGMASDHPSFSVRAAAEAVLLGRSW